MGIGFIIAGRAKNEDQAQPVATLIQFPMMFLSGIFFPRDAFRSAPGHHRLLAANLLGGCLTADCQ